MSTDDRTPTCTSTITERRYRCGLPRGHGGRHKGADSDWLWWHGNGEECREDQCWKCAALLRPEESP